MNINYEGWTKGTRASYGNDPTEWNGTNPSCNLCDKEVENMDEYCEDHQRCYYCGEREECEDCEEIDCEEIGLGNGWEAVPIGKGIYKPNKNK